VSVPRTLPDQILDLYGRIAEVERRARNRKRTGTISAVDHDKGLYRVKLSEQGGRPYVTGWIRPRQLGAGLVKIDVLLSEGEQVDVVSENGDMTDASIDLSTYSSLNERTNKDVPLLIRIGDATIAMSGEELTLKAGKIKIEGDIDMGEGYLKHNGKNVGDDHKHEDVFKGSDLTGPPQ
jgi:phage baseplate assembly protein gpV